MSDEAHRAIEHMRDARTMVVQLPVCVAVDDAAEILAKFCTIYQSIGFGNVESRFVETIDGMNVYEIRPNPAADIED